MLRRLCTWSILPLVYVDAAILEALWLEVRHVVRVEGRKTVVTRRAMEKYHVAEHALGIQHA